MDMMVLVYVVAIALLICLSAFFSMSETAFTSVNEIKLKKMANDGDKKASRALKIMADYEKFLTTILIGNNLVNIASAAIATTMFAILLGAQTGAVASTVIMTLLLLTFGEITPKSFAKKNPERICIKICGAIHWIIVIFTPLSWLFTKLARYVSGDGDRTITEDELEVMIDEIQSDGVLEKSESELIKSAMRLDDISISEIYVPRVDVVAVDVDSSRDELESIITASGFSRIPVYEGTIDNIIGVIYAKTFFTNEVLDVPFTIRDILMPVKYIPDTISVAQCLNDLQRSKIHMAVVLDSYGGTRGIVTLEDVLEELVGEIWDESDVISQDVCAESGGKYLVKGSANINDVMDIIGVHFDPEDYEESSVTGFIMYKLERAPTKGDQVFLDNVTITVLSVKGRRVVDCEIVLIGDQL